MNNQLLGKINDHTAVVSIIGLGYVGLPLAVAFAERGFPVVGIDVDERKVDSLNRGCSYVQDIPSARLLPLIKSSKTITGERSGQSEEALPSLRAVSTRPQTTRCSGIATPPLSASRRPSTRPAIRMSVI